MAKATTTAVEVRQVDGSTFLARGPSGHWVPIDTGTGELGHDSAPGPMELLLMALGGCTGIDIVLMLKKMRVEVDDFRISLSGKRPAEPPRVYTDITVTYHFWGNELPMAKLERAVSLSQEKYCSVANTINKVAKITGKIETHTPGEPL